MENNFQLLERRLLGAGDFVKVEQLNFIDRRGKKRHWECAARVNSNGAVTIIAEIIPDGKLILVKQFRPPAWCEIFEFPAGLIDPGESARDTAIRELYEETGFEGAVEHVFEDAMSSPGMSSEKMSVAIMKIDGTKYGESLPPSFQEENEDIETILVDKGELLNFLKQKSISGYAVDAKLLHYALALNLTQLKER
ncbi:MAG: NUDIX hydrolase [Victivallaceae bacterium]|nr:NUDIX hydrolase [Victivallaceae bacterium]MDD3116489.1 NUDIX hydrolase [Victivallaceae bacterium]MDD3702984.1 NUDIX hydrolase [Victivallaceae bacterium]MDD4317253.1 NUDIX hydrolase [Victivallaceae bacterium]NLK83490.1 NUDIX hydrolase [Lentisphaerota bacterium]